MYLTKKELQEKYKMGSTKVFRLMKEGLPYLKIGTSVRFDEYEVEEYFRNLQKRT